MGRSGGRMSTRIASISGLRGIVGDGLDPAIVAEFAAAYAAGCGPGPIVVGHDGRPSAPVFVPVVAASLAATGRDVLVAGPAATPTVGVLVRHHGAAGGVQVSASHNPPEYNGLKFFQPAGMVLGSEQGSALLGRLERREFGWATWAKLGRIHTLDDVDGPHLQKVLATVDVDRIRRRNFVVALDACHGAGGRPGESLLRSLGCRPLVIGGNPDGRYDHPPEPTEANLSTFAALTRAAGAAVGFAQDPDADRLAVVDETGRYIGEELTLALAASYRLAQEKGPLVLNLSTSRAAADVAASLGCPVHRTPVGEVNVALRMIAEDAILGGEGNGGVIDPRVGHVRDSLVGMAMILDLMASRGEPLSAIVDSLPKYTMIKRKYPTGEVSITSLFDRLIADHPGATADRRDGLRLDWPDGWVHLRSSNTEPIVRLIAEAADPGRAEELSGLVGRLALSP